MWFGEDCKLSGAKIWFGYQDIKSGKTCKQGGKKQNFSRRNFLKQNFPTYPRWGILAQWRALRRRVWGIKFLWILFKGAPRDVKIAWRRETRLYQYICILSLLPEGDGGRAGLGLGGGRVRVQVGFWGGSAVAAEPGSIPGALYRAGELRCRGGKWRRPAATRLLQQQQPGLESLPE